MREIKYQAWDKKDKVMIDEALVIKNIGLGEGSVLVDERTQQGHELIWRQYTGLKDKNGKEIYEGDWVKANGGIGKIVFMNGAFVSDCGEKHVYILDQLSRGETEFEIIGNIYKNKELKE